MKTQKHSKTQNMLLGIAIGDAFGAGYEFAYKDITLFEKNLDLNCYRENPNHKLSHYKPGMYTDDTQMSIAIAELLTSNKEFNHKNLADYFVNCYKRDPILGYAKGFQAFLDSISSGKELLEKINPASERNGAAMRSVPLGIIKDKEKLIKYATINAEITHNTLKGIASSVAVALLSHAHFYNNGKVDLESLLSRIKSIDLETSDHLSKIAAMKKFDPQLMCSEEYKNMGIPINGMRTAGAAFYLLSKYPEPKDVLKGAILLGGDTDSVAAISLGISMINNPMSKLPSFLFEQLTNHKYGKDYILDLGKRLHEKYFTP